MNYHLLNYYINVAGTVFLPATKRLMNGCPVPTRPVARYGNKDYTIYLAQCPSMYRNHLQCRRLEMKRPSSAPSFI